ncbi:MAG: hypothetical protein ACLQBQ_11665 [Smithella sp.]
MDDKLYGTFPVAEVNLAREYNVTLLGYVRSHSGYVYSGEIV